jgi:predicted dithiol-disulfide oxidoreductase (DUF899 family)
MSTTFPGESAEYRTARDRLLEHGPSPNTSRRVVMPTLRPTSLSSGLAGAASCARATASSIPTPSTPAASRRSVAHYYFLDETALGRQEDWEEPKGRATDARGTIPDFSS